MTIPHFTMRFDATDDQWAQVEAWTQGRTDVLGKGNMGGARPDWGRPRPRNVVLATAEGATEFRLRFSILLEGAWIELVKPATVYAKPDCPYCVKAKALLKQHGYEANVLDVTATEDTGVEWIKADLIARVTKETGEPPKTVPQIWIGEQYVGGYDALVTRLGGPPQ